VSFPVTLSDPNCPKTPAFYTFRVAFRPTIFVTGKTVLFGIVKRTEPYSSRPNCQSKRGKLSTNGRVWSYVIDFLNLGPLSYVRNGWS